jgi:Flp pilus assembly protein TadD
VLASLLALAFVGLTIFGATWWSGRERVLAADRMDLEARFEDELRDGFASLATRRAGDAERNFARALALRPGSTEALVGRALVLIEEGRYDESAAVLEQAPDTPAIRALRAVAEGASPPLDLGAEWLATSPSIELFVDGLRIAKQAERAPRHERKRVHELAAARFEEAVSRSRGARAFFHVKRAFAARDAGDERGVRSAAAALATLWPGSARALFTAGNTLREFDRRASIGLLRRSIALEPGWGPPHQNLGNAYYFERDYAAAIVELQEALRLDPRDADAWNTLGLSLAMHGCSDEARHAFHSALSLRPSFFEAWANLGWLDVNAGRYADAEPALRMALALAPHEPLPRSQLALVLHHRRDFQGEVAEREIVLGVAPHDRFSWAALSAALTSGGHPKEALRVAEVGLELSPGEPDLIRLRDIALSRIDPRELDD